MYYFYKNKVLTKFDNDIVEISKTFIDGEFCLEETNYKMLQTMILGRDIVEAEKSVKQDGNVLKVYKCKLGTINNRPPEFNFKNLYSMEVDVDKIKEAVKFVDKKGTRAELTGVYIEQTKEGCNIYGTDAYKMYIYYTGEPLGKGIILTPSLTNSLLKLNGKVNIEYNDNLAKIEVGETTVIGRLINGVYPQVYSVYKKLAGGERIELDTMEWNAYNTFKMINVENIEFDGENFKGSDGVNEIVGRGLNLVGKYSKEAFDLGLKIGKGIIYKDELSPIIFTNGDEKVIISAKR